MAIKKLKANLPCDQPDLKKILDELIEIHGDIIRLEREYNFSKHQILPKNKASAVNLVHYLALRKHDIREIQLKLSNWGISSLGRIERKVLANIDTVIHLISYLLNKEWKPLEKPPICFDEARKRLEDNSNLLLGKLPKKRRARIMVTMPSEAAYNGDFLLQLMQKGMNVARINCAHDGEETWLAIINNIRRAEKLTGNKCVIHMDLGGPKLRTGDLKDGPAVLKVRPRKNEWGKVVKPFLQFFRFGDADTVPDNPSSLVLCVKDDYELSVDEILSFKDTRHSNRKIQIHEIEHDGVWARVLKTSYFAEGMELHNETGKAIGTIGKVGPKPGYLLLQKGDILHLHRNLVEGQNARRNKEGVVLFPAQVSCTLPEALNDVHVGQRVWFDDGKIEGVIAADKEDHVEIEIISAKEGGTKLRAQKGINLPDSKLKFSALTEKDKADLDFVVRYADTIGLSFANRPKDVRNIIQEMRARTDHLPGLILKIETNYGFYNLPQMMLEAMSIPSCGVMIARGDLAIECGFGRLAELQEQILWVSEAAHMPVVWATQVLESLAKTGFQTRAEVTDAAMGQRAECIMLNKGPHIVKATAALDEILQRMQDHQTKKRSKHRKLKLAEDFFKHDRMIHV